ncbi:MAG: beta-galactosidase [Eubacteriales bacterium]|nr:beta-galactosidase [Eubacteriales bacterium]
MEKSIQTDGRLVLGVCYYPEHWDESLWDSDMQRMAQHGISVIRIGEFAWNLMEPRPGEFDFSFFLRVLDCARRHGLGVIFGTPTATPPAWLTQRYPEVLNAAPDGTLYRHGMRRHYNYNSAVYRRFCLRLIERMAQALCAHPAIVGWQIDNELNCEIDVFYSSADHDAFRRWLREKYATLDALNAAWGTVFWNQTYTDWSQVCLTRPTVSGSNNPHALLDEKRFISDSARSFCKMQADALRRYIPQSQFITTNGLFNHLDNHGMTQESLDFISYDSYPMFGYQRGAQADGLYDRRWAANLARVRSISPHFMVMEQQSGPGGWTSKMVLPAPKPGQMRLWAYQSVAAGADAVSFFRWRTAAFGTEIYWHGLLNYDSLDNRRIAELDTLRDEFSAIGERVAGSSFVASCAILRDYDNDFDTEEDQWVQPLTRHSETAWLLALERSHVPYDFFNLTDDTRPEELAGYELLICPHAPIMTQKRADALEAYVRRGGKVIFGARTGYKDLQGHCPMAPMPGALAWAGCTIHDFTQLGPFDPAGRVLINGREVEAPLFHDLLTPAQDARVLATFASDWYAGAPAAVLRELDLGWACYYGAALSEDAAYELLNTFALHCPADDALIIPAEVGFALREKDGHRLAFLLNYSAGEVSVGLCRPVKDLLNNPVQDDRLFLPAYGVALVELT